MSNGKSPARYVRYSELDATQRELVNAAEKAREESYSPYSNFKVGAALLTRDGKIMPGSNYENVAYGETICAERSAILGASARGYKLYKAIAIIARSEKSDTKEPVLPCGACLQVLKEAVFIAGSDIEVILSNTGKDRIRVTSVNELAPDIFGPWNARAKRNRYAR